MQVNQHQAGIQSSHRPPVAIHDAANQQKKRHHDHVIPRFLFDCECVAGEGY